MWAKLLWLRRVWGYGGKIAVVAVVVVVVVFVTNVVGAVVGDGEKLVMALVATLVQSVRKMWWMSW